MTLQIAFIGFGKSTTRYHLPFVLVRKDKLQVAHIFRRHEKLELEQQPQYARIHFTSQLDDILNDPQVKLVVVCTHVDSHFDMYRPDAPTQPGTSVDGAFYGLGVHTLDQMISLFGRPDRVAYDIRSVRNPLNPDDTFEAQLFYGDMKAAVKTSHLVKIASPKFIVHGTRGSFVKYGIDQQETSLKAWIMPGEPGFAADDSVAQLAYINDAGETVREAWQAEPGDYGRVYDALYQTLVHGEANYVSETDVLTHMELLERGFEQSSPSVVTLR